MTDNPMKNLLDELIASADGVDVCEAQIVFKAGGACRGILSKGPVDGIYVLDAVGAQANQDGSPGKPVRLTSFFIAEHAALVTVTAEVEQSRIVSPAGHA
jgi:hypothetical protein